MNSRPLLSIRVVHILLLIVITSLVYSNTLNNDYHLDSIPRVKNNTEINTFWPPFRFFTDVRTGSTIPQIADFRPIMPLSNAINIEVANTLGISRLKGLHIGNIVIHVLSAITIYFLFALLLTNWGATPGPSSRSVDVSHPAFAAALIFAIHPISGSAVNYIAARDLLLMAFFLVSSLLIYTSMRSKGDTVTGWVLTLLLMSLAILSKQAAITGFGLVFLFEWILVKSSLKDWRMWARTALFGIPTMAYFVLRHFWINQQSNSDQLRLVDGYTYPLTMLDSHLFYYARNIFWPFEMRALAKVEMIQSIFTPGAILGFLFIVTTLFIAWRLRKKQPLITFTLLAYWLLFSLTSSIFPFRYVVTDYRQYLPFVFLSLTLGLICFSSRRLSLSYGLLFGAALYFAISSWQINQHWETEESFWRQSVRYGGVALAHSNYGLAVAGKDQKLAEKHYQEALSQNPTHIYANINLGMLYLNQQRNQEGLAILRNTVVQNPEWALAHYWLSRGLRLIGQNDESLTALRKAADLDPRHLKYQYEAAQALQATDQKKESIIYLRNIVKIDPSYKLAGFMLGFAYQKTSDNTQAIDEYKRFLAFKPDYVQAQFNLAYAFMTEGDCQSAVIHFNRVLSLQPTYLESHFHLASCYRSLGEASLAARHEGVYERSRNQ